LADPGPICESFWQDDEGLSNGKHVFSAVVKLKVIAELYLDSVITVVDAFHLDKVRCPTIPDGE
jgi:G3E family GTPase